jgi:hypothetical protein
MWQLIGSIAVMYAVVLAGYWFVNKRAALREESEAPTGKE